ncbi:glucuronate isomerase [Luteolibacter ambystomatis]|uniref:Uronate isomerase n=1 Tax=Luteolibacter ambystomatis TaxID=2824561 RepID=A0A975PGQ6_9BACT|nr:glucuronate isomerase [Luteolibacter ambystomatis]QUE52973.1 glucuronate isomerase [Luteolibacter ambystomatis]
MPYLDDDFLLHSPTARHLFHEVAKNQPILDYHCHLSPQEIATDHRWENLADIWLGGDHYKWRLLRANGIDEQLITGDASPRDKFQAWAETVPYTLRNPIHHWTHLELRRYFGIDKLLSPATADEIWEKANARLAESDFSTRGILKKFDVRMVGTTDDPADSLDHHAAIATSGLSTKVLPTFRPDKVFQVDRPELFNSWIGRLEGTADADIATFSDLLAALQKRHDDFHTAGARLSDHGLDRCPALACSDAEASLVFDKARTGKPVTAEEKEKFSFYLMVFFGQLDAARGWTKQLHLGPFRNTNSAMAARLGPDSGFDTIGDTRQGAALVTYLDALASQDSLPKVVLYNINPSDNYLFAALTGAFQDGTVAGKIQFGSGWWFADQKNGMELQLDALSSTGLLSRFVGMLTDSRSFLSFPRHEYFRRILCNLIGTEADRGELPDDFEALSGLIRDVCFGNANRHFELNV